MDVRRLKVWLDRGLSLVTAIVVGLALYFLVTERLIPATRGQPVRVYEGERLPVSLRFQLLNVGTSRPGGVQVPGEQPVLLLVFDSVCPACYGNLPAWGEAIEAADGVASVLAVALERDRGAAGAYARRHLPAAAAVVPEDPREFIGRLGLGVVPSTVLIGADGVVEFVRQGSLDSTAVHSLIRVLGALAGSSTV